MRLRLKSPEMTDGLFSIVSLSRRVFIVKLMMLHSGMFIYNSNQMVFVIRDYQFSKYRFQFFCTVAIYEGPFEVYIKGFGKYTSKLLQQRIQ